MELASLRERITVQSRSYVNDQHGGHTIVWTDEKQIWAEIKPVRGVNGHNEELIYARIYRVRWRAEEKVSFLSQLKWNECLMRFITRPQQDVFKRWTIAFVKVIESIKDE